MPLTVVVTFAITARRPVTDAIIDKGSMAREQESRRSSDRSLGRVNGRCDDDITAFGRRLCDNWGGVGQKTSEVQTLFSQPCVRRSLLNSRLGIRSPNGIVQCSYSNTLLPLTTTPPVAGQHDHNCILDPAAVGRPDGLCRSQYEYFYASRSSATELV